MQCQWKDKVLAITAAGFEDLATDLFRFQYENNEVYRAYADALQTAVDAVRSIHQIPFLPIRFFKTHRVMTTSFATSLVFESSGTTGSINSRHYIREPELYRESFTKGFQQFYGPVNDWCIIGLLPSYLERQHSSLVYMVNELIRLSGHPQSGFYLNEFDQLFAVLQTLKEKKQKTILIGVTFGLLDFAEAFSSRIYPGLFEHTIVMETGGMKGRRREMVRQEVQDILKRSFHVPLIHSEYGMTELLSQAYSNGEGIFRCPPWMKILLRDEEDPLSIHLPPADYRIAARGAINIIDLANIYSCSFIATDDAGQLYADGSFTVLGRIDNTDLRGCSLLTL
jgi:hypothetical protein